MATEPRQATTVYLSYAQQDKALKQELENHLAVLRQTGQISLGGEREIQPGTDWAQTIDPRLSTADIVLLLLSADLLGSGYCSVAEVRQALARHRAGKALVIPMVLRRVDVTGLPISVFPCLPGDDKERWKPVMSWADRDEAWWKVIQGLRHAIATLQYWRGSESSSSQPGQP